MKRHEGVLWNPLYFASVLKSQKEDHLFLLDLRVFAPGILDSQDATKVQVVCVVQLSLGLLKSSCQQRILQ